MLRKKLHDTLDCTHHFAHIDGHIALQLSTPDAPKMKSVLDELYKHINETYK